MSLFKRVATHQIGDMYRQRLEPKVVRVPVKQRGLATEQFVKVYIHRKVRKIEVHQYE